MLLAALLGLAASRTDTFQIHREILIQAPPEKIYALLEDFHNWPRWAPQDREDAGLKRSYSGVASGNGAISQWQSSGKSGAGRMEIVEAWAPARLVVQVDFTRPFVAHNRNEFVLEPEAGFTRVIWAMQGSNVYLMKLMSLFIDMDRMMGRHFEDGLAALKTAAEQPG
jgi:uncharacterized protein YndB with AHSA1/START domain